MKFDLTGSGVLAIGAIIAAAGLAWWVSRNRELFNPADQRNLANQGAGAAVIAITGGAAAGGEDSLGGVAARVREWFSGDDAAIQALKAGSPGTLTTPPEVRQPNTIEMPIFL